MAKRTEKTERDELSSSCRLLTKLLMYEVSNGIIPLPEGVENYTPPPIPFAERRAFLDAVSKGLLIDMKVNPESEPSGFELLKSGMNKEGVQFNGRKIKRRGASSERNSASTYGDDAESLV